MTLIKTEQLGVFVTEGRKLKLERENYCPTNYSKQKNDFNSLSYISQNTNSSTFDLTLLLEILDENSEKKCDHKLKGKTAWTGTMHC